MARIAVVEPRALADYAAERLTGLITAATDACGEAFVSLTGGTTPRATYEALADGSRPWGRRIDWSRIHLFWGDERCVPPDHPDSNFGMAQRALISRVPIPDAQVHRMRGELPDVHAAAAAYAKELREAFAAAGRHEMAFDVMLLGMGADGHIASIFPGDELVHAGNIPGGRHPGAEPGRSPQAHPPPVAGSDDGGAPVAGVFAPHLQAWRITLTPEVILNASSIVLLVSGAAKADAVAAAIDGPLDVSECPAQLLRNAGDRVEWIVDPAAAARLSLSGRTGGVPAS